MEQTEFVVGFSELKDLLIDKYKIQTPREELRLYFTVTSNQLLMHDFKNHNRIVLLSGDVFRKYVERIPMNTAAKLIRYSIESKMPADMLNDHFMLYGYFTF